MADPLAAFPGIKKNINRATTQVMMKTGMHAPLFHGLRPIYRRLPYKADAEFGVMTRTCGENQR